MQDTAVFSSLVGGIYDCIAEPSHWPSVLGELTGRYDGVTSVMGVVDTGTNRTRFATHFGPEDIIQPLITTYAADWPFYDVIHRMEIDAPLSMVQFLDVAGPAAREKMAGSRLAHEWIAKHQLTDYLSIALMKQPNRVGVLVINTPTARGPVQQHELDDFALLAPHIRRAVTIGDLFEDGQRQVNVFRSIVDQLSTATFCVDADMKLSYANQAGEELLRAGMLASGSRKLKFANDASHRAIAKAVIMGERNEFALGSSGIGVPLARVEKPAIAHVLPLTRRSAPNGFSQGTAAIFVAAPGAAPLPSLDAIAALFGLTAAEKRITGLITQGMKRSEISQSSGVSENTVKTQLNAILDKTGMGDTNELKNLIRELTPPVK